MPTEEFGEDLTPPPGSILIWTDPISEIPSGWAVCDGNNGTPNLLDKFIRSVGSGENPGATGGQNSLTLSESQIPSHSHSGDTYSSGGHRHSIYHRNRAYGTKSESGQTKGGGTAPTNTTGSHSHSTSVSNSGSNASIDNRPQFYRVAYIMKL